MLSFADTDVLVQRVTRANNQPQKNVLFTLVPKSGSRVGDILIRRKRNFKQEINLNSMTKKLDYHLIQVVKVSVK